MGLVEKPFGTQRTNKPRTWRSLDRCVRYLRDEMNIVRVDMLDASNYSDDDAFRRQRPDASERLKRAHEAAAYDEWYREAVQASIDDPRPSLSNEEANAHMERVFATLPTEMKRVNFQVAAHKHTKLKAYAAKEGKSIKEILTKFVTNLLE